MDHVVDIERVISQLESIRSGVLEAERAAAEQLLTVHPEFRDSARNLVHYLALRNTDIRDLQQDLAVLGLSSLGRSERNVLASLAAVRSALGHTSAAAEAGSLLLHSPVADKHNADILGEYPQDRDASIMVTMPTEAATDRQLVVEMLDAGMNIARVNCARDDAETWAAMIRNIREASEACGMPCRVIIDLAGPKTRTGLWGRSMPRR